MDVCVTHLLASSELAAAAWGTGVSAEAKDALKRDKYGRAGMCVCRLVPLSYDMYGQAGPPVLSLLHEHAELAAATGAVCKRPSCRKRCANSARRKDAASHGRSSPRHRCERA